MRHQIEEVFNKSLSRLQQQSIKVHKLLEATQLAGKPRLETRISLAQFKVGDSVGNCICAFIAVRHHARHHLMSLARRWLPGLTHADARTYRIY